MGWGALRARRPSRDGGQPCSIHPFSRGASMQLQLQVAGAGRSNESEESEGAPRRSGLQSILATATALAGIFATANPKSALAQALNQALPALSGALPQVI